MFYADNMSLHQYVNWVRKENEALGKIVLTKYIVRRSG